MHAAGVTRGAMYHQFADKQDLFAAVFEAVEAELTARIDAVVSESGRTDPLELMHLGARAWLDACADPEVHRIVLIEAPAVLGWERWREIGLRYGMGLVQRPARVRDQRRPVAAAAGRAAGARPDRRAGRGGAVPGPRPTIRPARAPRSARCWTRCSTRSRHNRNSGQSLALPANQV